MRTFIALLVCVLAVSGADQGRRAPGFALLDAKMKLHDLYDYRGKPVIIEFMLTSCPHCMAFAGVLDKVQKKYGDKVAILSIANPPDDFKSVARFVDTNKIAYPVMLDIGQVAYSYMLKASFSQPQVFIVDANGIIYNHFEYAPLNRDIFEGNGLINELDRLMGMGVQAPKK
jgi:thiol-disulfide isomerase/thioredoxin